MQIRLMNEEDMDAVISLWLAASEQAHHFIDGAYWQSKQEDMRSVYLPMAESYVLENEGEIAGFISVVQHLLAAFVRAPGPSGQRLRPGPDGIRQGTRSETRAQSIQG